MESRHEDKYILKYSALEHDFEELQQVKVGGGESKARRNVEKGRK
jgi:hypothetical protein